MNVCLIGMSGAGKSHIGKRLAKRLGYAFVDTDKYIRDAYKQPLQQILEEVGEERFLEIEESEIMKLKGIENTVFAPGGSVVYSEAAMQLLREISTVVYIKVPARVIESRVDTAARGIIGLANKSFRQLYAERAGLYKKYAHFEVRVGRGGSKVAIERIVEYLEKPQKLEINT